MLLTSTVTETVTVTVTMTVTVTVTMTVTVTVTDSEGASNLDAALQFSKETHTFEERMLSQAATRLKPNNQHTLSKFSAFKRLKNELIAVPGYNVDSRAKFVQSRSYMFRYVDLCYEKIFTINLMLRLLRYAESAHCKYCLGTIALEHSLHTSSNICDQMACIHIYTADNQDMA